MKNGESWRRSQRTKLLHDGTRIEVEVYGYRDLYKSKKRYYEEEYYDFEKEYYDSGEEYDYFGEKY